MMSGAPRSAPAVAESSAARDETLIRQTLDRHAAAIHAKDAKVAIACLSEDVVAYDLAPPLAFDSAAARDAGGLQEWFDTWQGPIRSAVRDLHVEVGGDVAFAYALQHMTGTKIDGENVDLWFRATAGLIKTEAGWRIAHLHNSVPFAMDGSGKALLDLKP
jgi:ketosteroid isomerase-like protein